MIWLLYVLWLKILVTNLAVDEYGLNEFGSFFSFGILSYLQIQLYKSYLHLHFILDFEWCDVALSSYSCFVKDLNFFLLMVIQCSLCYSFNFQYYV